MKIGFAQINTTVGDLPGNAALILDACRQLSAAGAEVILTPELALTGYPPQDLLFKSRFVSDCQRTLEELHAQVDGYTLVVGFVAANPAPEGRPFFNAAAVLEKGRPAEIIHKSLLPTYDVFDEARYFEPGQNLRTITIRGVKTGITICEDIWTPENLHRPLYVIDPLERLMEQGAEVILNLSASPFQLDKPARRLAMIEGLSREHGVPIAYCNACGGNDQIIFDGNSLAVSPAGGIWQGAAFQSQLEVVDLSTLPIHPPVIGNSLDDLHDALVLGLRDYMRKCGFRQCVLGLSGGIDSAVTAAIAVEAVGKDNVSGVAMPTSFSSSHSVDDALALAKNLGIRASVLQIQEAFETFRRHMEPALRGTEEDATEENMQARLRGLTLMALSNKFGSLLLTTGNKSELAVGYCTLYGDMCGGLAVISDVPKTLVYKLAAHMNRHREIIPPNTITKPPSAELRPDQTDQDTLPPYDILDEILRLYVEENLSAAEITTRGFDEETVRWVLRRVDLNEYKRQQAAPGLKVTGRAFGIGRRMPIAQRYIS